MIKLLQRKFIRTSMIAVTVVMVIFLIAINALNYYTMERDASKTMQLILAGDSQGLGEPGGPGAGGIGDPGGPGAAGPGGQKENGPGGPADSGASRSELPEGMSAPVLPEDMEPPAGSGEEPPELPDGMLQSEPESAPEKPIDEVTEEALSSEQYFSVRLAEDGQMIDTDVSHTTAVDESAAETLAAEAEKTGDTHGQIGGYRFRRIDDRMSGGARFVFLDASQQQRAVFRTLLVTLLVGAVTWVLMLLLVIFMSRRAILPIAENIERQKQFVTDAGHEIKTPLAIIQANADVLELHTGSNKWIDNIRSQITRLGSLTQNMLTLSRMEEGDSVAMPAQEFDAGAALLEALRPFRESAEIRGVSIEENVSRDVMLTWQRDAYLRLLTILFENAVKYVREGGFIAVSLRREGREVVIEQRNDSAEPLTGDPERLFDRFYRADRARTQKAGGSGIGLSVARAITEQAGGTIRAAYESEILIAFRLRLRDVKK